MEINWYIFSIVFIGAIVLLFFLIKRNIKDEKEMEKEFNYFKKEEELHLKDELKLKL